MKLLFTVLLLASTLIVDAQNLYIKTFGNQSNTPIIFMHGGPGYNCASFEATTAQNLANSGFFVIVYDRRGEGRSKDVNAKFTFEQSIEDVNSIFSEYKLQKATVIGHSFGGILATNFATAYPNKVQALVLVGAPMGLQSSFKNIISKSKALYLSKNDSLNLMYVGMLEKMDTASLEYAVYCFGHAMQNKFYNPKKPTEEAQKLYASFKTDTILTKYASKMTQEPTKGYWKNEHYTTLNISTTLQNLKTKGIKIYGLYGKEDGLYSTDQIMALQQITGDNNLKYLDNCSHSVFVDQQTEFINSLKMWVGK
jgi:proline iminopeptidase